MNKLIAQVIRLLLKCYKDTEDARLLDVIENLTYVRVEKRATPEEGMAQVSFVGPGCTTATLENIPVTVPDNCDFTSFLQQRGRSQYSMGALVEDKTKDDNGEEEEEEPTS